MIVDVKKSFLSGTVDAIPSKSYAHRILICSAFCKEPTVVKNLIRSNDILATMDCLSSLGATFKTDNGVDYTVYPIENLAQNAELHCNDSGATIRFLMGVIAALGCGGKLVGTHRLIQRPEERLIDAIKEGGGIVEQFGDSFIVSGCLTADEVSIRAVDSSQFITGLMLGYAVAKRDGKINLIGKVTSISYIDMTIDTLEQFGVEVERGEDYFFVKGSSGLKSPLEITVEGDWSNAAMFLVAGALNGDITVTGLKADSKQGDKEVVELLKEMGAEITVENDSVHVVKSSLEGITFDSQNIPDIVLPLSVAMSEAEGMSIIKNVERLSLKECDRLNAVLDMLTSCGIDCEYYNGRIIIVGGTLNGAELNSKDDHRVVMSLAIIGSVCGKVQIINAESVSKSYPTFFEDFKKLGGVYSVK